MPQLLIIIVVLHCYTWSEQTLVDWSSTTKFPERTTCVRACNGGREQAGG